MVLKEVFSALSDSTRLRILEMLREGDMTQKEIKERLEMDQPAVSYHMDKLVRSGLVLAIREGRQVRYSLNMGALDIILEYLMRLKKEGKS